MNLNPTESANAPNKRAIPPKIAVHTVRGTGSIEGDEDGVEGEEEDVGDVFEDESGELLLLLLLLVGVVLESVLLFSLLLIVPGNKYEESNKLSITGHDDE